MGDVLTSPPISPLRSSFSFGETMIYPVRVTNKKGKIRIVSTKILSKRYWHDFKYNPFYWDGRKIKLPPTVVEPSEI